MDAACSDAGNTRQRIQDVALELFAEQGYEKTSLREIAERLDVTKAALYYHFKTKEDILISLFEDLTQADRRADRLGPSSSRAPWRPSRRSSAATARPCTTRRPLFRFMQENQATDARAEHRRDLQGPHARACSTCSRTRTPPLTDQVRCVSALFTMHAGMFALQDIEGDPEEKRKAVLEVAIELVTTAHGAGPERAP